MSHLQTHTVTTFTAAWTRTDSQYTITAQNHTYCLPQYYGHNFYIQLTLILNITTQRQLETLIRTVSLRAFHRRPARLTLAISLEGYRSCLQRRQSHHTRTVRPGPITDLECGRVLAGLGLGDAVLHALVEAAASVVVSAHLVTQTGHLLPDSRALLLWVRPAEARGGVSWGRQ